MISFFFFVYFALSTALFSQKNKIITCKTPKQKWNCVIIFDFYHKIENKNDASNTFIWKFSLVSFFLFFVLMKGCWGIQNFFFWENLSFKRKKKMAYEAKVIVNSISTKLSKSFFFVCWVDLLFYLS